MVLATQNPIEYEGTFPLPEAQLDRFLMRIALGYPVARTADGDPRRAAVPAPDRLAQAVTTADELMAMQEQLQGGVCRSR